MLRATLLIAIKMGAPLYRHYDYAPFPQTLQIILKREQSTFCRLEKANSGLTAARRRRFWPAGSVHECFEHRQPRRDGIDQRTLRLSVKVTF